MAVPKKRTGHSAQGKRRSNWKATKPETAKCPNCGATVLAHTVCMSCGQYKGKVVSIKAPGYVESGTEEVKSTKKSNKSKAKTEPKVEETKVEEVKTETSEEVKAEAVEETKAEESEEKAVDEVKAETEEKTEE